MHMVLCGSLVIGASKVGHVKGDVESLDIRLTKKQMPYLDTIVPFRPGFPLSMIN